MGTSQSIEIKETEFLKELCGSQQPNTTFWNDLRSNMFKLSPELALPLLDASVAAEVLGPRAKQIVASNLQTGIVSGLLTHITDWLNEAFRTRLASPVSDTRSLPSMSESWTGLANSLVVLRYVIHEVITSAFTPSASNVSSPAVYMHAHLNNAAVEAEAKQSVVELLIDAMMLFVADVPLTEDTYLVHAEVLQLFAVAFSTVLYGGIPQSTPNTTNEIVHSNHPFLDAVLRLDNNNNNNDSNNDQQRVKQRRLQLRFTRSLLHNFSATYNFYGSRNLSQSQNQGYASSNNPFSAISAGLSTTISVVFRSLGSVAAYAFRLPRRLWPLTGSNTSPQSTAPMTAVDVEEGFGVAERSTPNDSNKQQNQSTTTSAEEALLTEMLANRSAVVLLQLLYFRKNDPMNHRSSSDSDTTLTNTKPCTNGILRAIREFRDVGFGFGLDLASMMNSYVSNADSDSTNRSTVIVDEDGDFFYQSFNETLSGIAHSLSQSPAATANVGCLLFYTLLQENRAFAEYVSARTDVDSFMLPLLRHLYLLANSAAAAAANSASTRTATSPQSTNSHQDMYIALIVAMQLTVDTHFSTSMQRTLVPVASVQPWYRDRLLGPAVNIRLDSLVISVVLRAAAAQPKDGFLVHNALAVLTNSAPHWLALHPHPAQRLVMLLRRIAARFRNAVTQLSQSTSRSDATDIKSDTEAEAAERLETYARTLFMILETIHTFLAYAPLASQATNPNTAASAGIGSGSMEIGTGGSGSGAVTKLDDKTGFTITSGSNVTLIYELLLQKDSVLQPLLATLRGLVSSTNQSLASQIQPAHHLCENISAAVDVFAARLRSHAGGSDSSIPATTTVVSTTTESEIALDFGAAGATEQPPAVPMQWTVEEVMAILENAARFQWPKFVAEKLRPTVETASPKYRYEEGDAPEDFFLPYIWTLTLRLQLDNDGVTMQSKQQQRRAVGTMVWDLGAIALAETADNI